jgi:hypothetical protein
MKVGVRAIGAALAALITAAANAGTISDPVIVINASSSLGQGTLSIPYIPGNYNPVTHVYNWSLPNSVDILGANEAVIATVSQLSTFIMVDPVVNVGFVLTAGAANTSVSISSATLTFAAIPGATGQASAQIGATDTDGNGTQTTTQSARLRPGPGSPRQRWLKGENLWVHRGSSPNRGQDQISRVRGDVARRRKITTR